MTELFALGAAGAQARLGRYAGIAGGRALTIDGVGSKAQIAYRHAPSAHALEVLGHDCVAVNANDLLCVGARPAWFLDYLVVPPDRDQFLGPLLEGIGGAAVSYGLEVVGGETARIEGAFDVAGVAVGLIEAPQLADRDWLAPGDVLLGLPSLGLHCNGIGAAAAEGLTVAELLEATACYVRVADAFGPLTGAWHISGGGLRNLLRGSRGMRFVVTDPLPSPPVFETLERDWGTWNLGTGFVVSTREADVPGVLAALPGARVIGDVREGRGPGYGQVEVPDDGWEHRQ